MIKRITATVVALSLLVTSAFTCMASSDAFDDIDGSIYKNAIEALYSLNLVTGDENKNFNPHNEITRYEFLAMVIRMIGQEQTAQASKSAEMPFEDIPSDHWARGYVYLAYTLGIVNGISETEFGGDRMVTYNQAIKMIVAALGYGVAAEEKGGYPSGYLLQAGALDINDGVDSKERNLKREEVAGLVLNGLTVPMLQKVNDDYTQEHTPLEAMGYKKYMGVVTSTFEAQTGNRRLTEDMVEISGVLYKTAYFVAADLLGASVTYYTMEEGGDEIVRYVHKRKDSTSLEVSARNILPSAAITEFAYDIDGKVKKAKLSGASITVVYNGRVAGSAYINSAEFLKPESGSVSLRDSNDDGVYDIAIVNEYITLVASAVSNNNILDKYGNSISLDMDEKQISVYKNGMLTDISAIESGDILTVARSFDREKLIVYITNDTFSGTVKHLAAEGSETLYGISSEGETKNYRIAAEYLRAQAEGKSVAAKFDIGDSGVFYLNYVGEIAYCVLTDNVKETSYGYILNAGNGSGMGETNFKILTMDNKFSVFEAESEIYFGRMNGASYTRTRENPSVAVEYLSSGVEFASQVCSYILNDEGKLKELQLADKTGGSDQYLTLSSSTKTMNYSQNLLNQKYIVDENTAVFYIPNAGQYEDIMATGKYNKFLKNGRVAVSLYDVENSHVGALLYTPLSIERYDEGMGEYETIIDNVNSPVLYIQKVSHAMGEDGNSYMCITGIEDGEIVEVKVAERLSGISDDKSLLKPGVAIQYEKNDLTRSRALTSDEESVLMVFKVVYDFNTDQPMKQTYNYADSYQARPQISVIHSKVAAVEPSFIGVELSDKAAPLSGGTVYMSYDKQRAEKFELINLEQVSIGQEIMLRLRYLNTREAVVIE